MVICPQSCARAVSGRKTIVVPGEKIELGWAKVRATSAYNQGLRGLLLHKKDACVGYIVTVGGKTIYHAGDTDIIPEMASLGPVDIALLPIGGMFTMNADSAIQAAAAIKPKIVVPMHHLRASPGTFKARLESATGIKVVSMQTGDVVEL